MSSIAIATATTTQLPPRPPIDHSDPDLVTLLPRLTDADGTVRRLALIELAELEEEDHAPWLAWALRDPDAQVRAEAAARLAYWEQPDVVQALAHALTDPDASVRQAAAHSLAELKDAESGRLLLPWLDMDDAFVKASVLRALRELRLAESFAPALRAASDANASVRLEAVGVLGWLKQQQALQTLVALARADVHADVRRAAAGALGLAAGLSMDATVLPALLAALQDPVWQVREEAATTLGKLSLVASANALVAALEDDYWQVRQRAARALGRLKQQSAIQPLVAHALQHSSANLRKEAAVALGEIGDPSAIPALEAAGQDSDPDVRKLARLALTNILAKR